MIGFLRRLPDRFAGRIVITVVLSLFVTLGITLFVLWMMRPPPDPRFFEARWLADQVASAAPRVFAAAPEARGAIVDGLEERSWLSYEWRQDDPRIANESAVWPYAQLRTMIETALEDQPYQVVVARLEHGWMAPGPRRGGTFYRGGRDRSMSDFPVAATFLIGVRGPDNTWLTIAPREPWHSFPFATILLWLVLVSTAVCLLSVWAARRLVVPLDALAQAATRLGIDRDAPEVRESGPAELRAISRAFNEMRERLKRFVDDRTQMIAAISHDLRTPLTRLRLRAEYVTDSEQRRKLLDDIAQMETMIGETLAFASGDASREKRVPIDIATMLASICDDLADAGRSAGYDGPDHAVATGQPTALRRAFTNLIENAATHGATLGEGARVTLAERGAAIEIAIADDGPGIPEAEMEKVFAPFYRLDRSRSRDTGGAGLGLAVTRTILRAHGGEVRLANGPAGGLIATVTLPRLELTPSAPADRRAKVEDREGAKTPHWRRFTNPRRVG